MIKTMLVFGALTIAMASAVPAAAQMAAGGSLPKCSATVRDACDQGANDPKAMTAAQAEATGGVGDRKSDNAASATAGGTARHTTMRHRSTTHHKVTKKPAMMTPDATAEPTPK